MWTNNLLFDYISSKASQRILQTKRIELLRHYFSLPFEESEKIKQGELETLVVSDIPNWVRLYGSILIEYIHAIAQFIGAFIALQHIDIQFILWITPFLFFSAIVPILMGEKGKGYCKHCSKKSIECCRDGVTVCKGYTRFT